MAQISDTDKNKQLALHLPPGPTAVYHPEPMCPPPAYDQCTMSRGTSRMISDTEKNKQLAVHLPPGPTAVYHPEPMCPPPAYDQCTMSRGTSRTVTIQHGIYDDTNPPIYGSIHLEERTYMISDTDRDRKLVLCPPLGLPHVYNPGPMSPPLVYEKILAEEETHMDASYLLNWSKECQQSSTEEIDMKEERKIVTEKAWQVYTAIQQYNLLLTMHVGTLREHIDGLLSIADKLDKVSKGTKIARITGGTTGAVGGLMAVIGVIFAPLTLGASLALTAVGVGVATAGGVTGASAAIAKKVKTKQDKKNMEKIFQQYTALMVDIEGCLKRIDEGLGQLKQHDPSILDSIKTESVTIARVVELATRGRASASASARAIEANRKASGIMQGFALGMDMYFTQGKHGQKLKKSLKSKFGKKIRMVAEEMKTGLDELMHTKELLS